MSAVAKSPPSSQDLLWMGGGAALFFVIAALAVAVHFRGGGTNGDLGRKAQKLAEVSAMRSALASASEAEKSAVMAVTDEESASFADQARAAEAEVERRRGEIANLLESGGSTEQKTQLAQFARGFAEFRKIDAELLSLAVRNSNLKAYALAFDPAARAIEAMDSALTRIADRSAGGADAARITRLALGAQSSALRIQALLAPHIAEESDARMDALEAEMNRQDATTRASLQSLRALPGEHDDADLATAQTSYDRFGELRSQILRLSRENTNVRSTAMSLRRKQKVTLACRSALDALEESIAAEPPVDFGRFGPPIRTR